MERRRRSAKPELAAEQLARSVRRRDKPRERWLLTRKTWKYMADAGRRLVPDGVQNRIEDVPKIENYFQEVCSKEQGFLLWRKSSYPGAIPRPRRLGRPRAGSVRTRSSSDEPEAAPRLPLHIYTSGGRLDIAKLKRDFLATPIPTPKVDEDEVRLADALRRYLRVDEGNAVASDVDALADALRNLLDREGARRRPVGGSESDSTRHGPFDVLLRQYSRAPDGGRAIRDLLTDRKILKKLYRDLRKTGGYRGNSGGFGSSGNFGAGLSGGRGFGESGGTFSWRGPLRSHRPDPDLTNSGYVRMCRAKSPPPLIEVRACSSEERAADRGTQTVPVSEEELRRVQAEHEERERVAAAEAAQGAATGPGRAARRRSSVDHDDVSQSVSDTIKRYLRMARKKSVDSDKADRFKRVNYDKNLRNIKAREVNEGDDDGLNKGCQTDTAWWSSYRSCRRRGSPEPLESPTSPSSPPSPHSPHSPVTFLSSLLGLSPNAPSGAGGMQKSRSSGSVVQSVSKRIWRTRSRSSNRAAPAPPAAWTPQGSCAWSDGCGRAVRLTDTSLLTLSEVERRALQQAALARLRQLNLGVPLKLPEDSSSASTKPKRRAYLLKRKALTTGFFDQGRAKDGDKDKGSGGSGGSDGGESAFGVPLEACVSRERARRRQLHGSRTSLASRAALSTNGNVNTNSNAPDFNDDSESCDSVSSRERLAGSVPGQLQWAGLGPDSGAECDEEAEEEAGEGGPRVPGLLSACLAHLRRHGLETVGIFRVSSSKKRVRELREEWEVSREAALEGASCPHDVATLLKEFLRDLPDPLLCRDLYPAFLQTQKIRNRSLQWESLRLLVQLLPAAHRDTLNALLAFLAQVAEHAEDHQDENGDMVTGNKMDSTNLATVFAPNILHCIKPGSAPKAEINAEALCERADVINVVRTLIERQAGLWTLPAELLHDAYIQLAHTAPQHLDRLLGRRAAHNQCAAERVSASFGAAFVDGVNVGATDGASAGADSRKVWSREECLHEKAATGGPDLDMNIRQRDKIRDVGGGGGGGRRRTGSGVEPPRGRQDSSGSAGSLSSALTIVTRMRSSGGVGGGGGDEGCGSSGVVCGSVRSTGRAEREGSVDSVSDFYEGGPASGWGSETWSGAGGVITASLRIPARGALAHAALTAGGVTTGAPTHDDIPYIEDTPHPPAPPRRRQRSTSGSESSARPGTGAGSDSAVGSLSSPATSPPMSPTNKEHYTTQGYSSPTSPPASLREPRGIANIGGAVLRSKTADFERMLHLGREKNTSDSRASMLAHHATTPHTTTPQAATPHATTPHATTQAQQEKRGAYLRRKYTRHIPDAGALEAASANTTAIPVTASISMSSASQVYKRGELISSVQSKQK